MRNTKTEYVSCPSCGRTLFDLQEVTEEIRQSTGHLPGVSIAVMGCIVNGPGEMADADFGWVFPLHLSAAMQRLLHCKHTLSRLVDCDFCFRHLSATASVTLTISLL